MPGFTFMWIAATVAHYLAGDGALTLAPVALLGFAGGFVRDAIGESPRRVEPVGGVASRKGAPC